MGTQISAVHLQMDTEMEKGDIYKLEKLIDEWL